MNRESRGQGLGESPQGRSWKRESGMPYPGQEVAELAARLARAVAGRGVVCLGCDLESGTTAPSGTTRITLSRPPFGRVEIELGQLLMLVSLMPAEHLDLRTCAAAGVPEVWLYDVAEGVLESLRLPRAGRYRQRSLILPGERVALAALPGVELTPLSRAGSAIG